MVDIKIKRNTMHIYIYICLYTYLILMLMNVNIKVKLIVIHIIIMSFMCILSIFDVGQIAVIPSLKTHIDHWPYTTHTTHL